MNHYEHSANSTNLNRATRLARFGQVLQSFNDIGNVKGDCPGSGELNISYVFTGPSDKLYALHHTRVYVTHSSM